MPKLLLLPGDGIGPEVTDEVKRVAERLTNELTVDERPFGGVSLRAHGVPLPDETLTEAKASDAVLMALSGARRRVDTQARGRCRARPDDRARADRRGLFRQAARG